MDLIKDYGPLLFPLAGSLIFFAGLLGTPLLGAGGELQTSTLTRSCALDCTQLQTQPANRFSWPPPVRIVSFCAVLALLAVVTWGVTISMGRQIQAFVERRYLNRQNLATVLTIAVLLVAVRGRLVTRFLTQAQPPSV